MHSILAEKLKNLPTIGEIVRKHEEDAAFRPILDRARLRVAIAREIKRARENARFTQADLAEALGVSQAMIGRLESLKDKRIPSLELLAKVAAATGSKITLDQPRLHIEVAAPRKATKTPKRRGRSPRPYKARLASSPTA